ncbi:hypothetical protein [Aeromonas phage 85AhydR10PP]|nr:hypothetical protein [Aeromonas phage 85AhydR10PP]
MTCERIDKALTQALTAHANWCRTGRPQASAKAIMTAITGKNQTKIIPLEEQIESLICRMFQANPVAADILRLEYGAGWQNVVKRRPGHRIRNFLWLESTLEQRAKIMKMEPHLYTLYLRSARNTLIEELSK